MAYYSATKNGDFNDPTVWGGTPTIGDCVSTASRCIAITNNVNLGLNGGFLGNSQGGFYIVNQTISLTGNVFSGGTDGNVFTFCNSNVQLYNCSTCSGYNIFASSPVSSISVINSNLTAISNFCTNYLFSPIYNQPFPTTLLAIDSTSNVLINGNILTNNSSCAATQAILNNGNLCINGDINGGGVTNNNILTVNGCVIPTNTDISNIQNNGTMSIYGSVYSSTSTKPAVYSTGPCYVQKLIGGPTPNKGFTFPVAGCFQFSSADRTKNCLVASNVQSTIRYNPANTQKTIVDAKILPSITNYTNNNPIFTVQFSKPHGLYSGACITCIPNTYSFYYVNDGNTTTFGTGTYRYGYCYCSSTNSTYECNNSSDYSAAGYLSINTFSTYANVVNVLSPVSAIVDRDIFPYPDSYTVISNQHRDGNCSNAGMASVQISNIINTSFSTPLLSACRVSGNVTPPPNIIGGFCRSDGSVYKPGGQFPTSTGYPIISSVTTNSNYTTLNFTAPISSPNTNVSSYETYGILQLSGLYTNTNFNNLTNTYIISAIKDPYTLVLYTSSFNNFVNSNGIAIIANTNKQGNVNFNNNILLFCDTSINPIYSNYDNAQVVVNNYLDPSGLMNGGVYNAKLINPNTLLIPVNNSSLASILSGNVYTLSGQQIYQDPSISLATLLPPSSSVRFGVLNGAYVGTMAVPPVSSVRGGFLYDSSSSQVGTYFFPSVSDVRLNTVFDIASSGRVNIPPASSVYYNIPVDNTLGTAANNVMSVSAIWNTTPQTYIPNTIGDLTISKSAKKADLFSIL